MIRLSLNVLCSIHRCFENNNHSLVTFLRVVPLYRINTRAKNKEKLIVHRTESKKLQNQSYINIYEYHSKVY